MAGYGPSSFSPIYRNQNKDNQYQANLSEKAWPINDLKNSIIFGSQRELPRSVNTFYSIDRAKVKRQRANFITYQYGPEIAWSRDPRGMFRNKKHWVTDWKDNGKFVRAIPIQSHLKVHSRLPS